MNIETALWASFFGFVAAVALPLGTITIKFWKPSEKILAFLLAFGSGALLAASLDLVSGATEKGEFNFLAIGCVIGGALFVGVNGLINSKGGFLRKKSTAVRYLKKQKLHQFKQIFEKLSQVNLFQSLPPEEVQSIVPYIFSRNFPAGSTIFKQGEPGDSFYIIEEGEIDIMDEKNKSKIATLHKNDVVGEMALVTGELRSASAVSASDVKVWVILKEHFDTYLITKPAIAEAVNEMVNVRISDLREKKSIDLEEAHKWAKSATKNLGSKVILPTETDVEEAHAKHGGAGIAIWLGNLFDCIPGALIIGASMTAGKPPLEAVSISLIAGLFLANYPESLSSSADMQEHGDSFSKVFWMWSSLFVISGVFAFIGNVTLSGGGGGLLAVLMEGVAAGAMLTMIAETMLPEAYLKFSSITGLSTLLGFLVAGLINTI